MSNPLISRRKRFLSHTLVLSYVDISGHVEVWLDSCRCTSLGLLLFCTTKQILYVSQVMGVCRALSLLVTILLLGLISYLIQVPVSYQRAAGQTLSFGWELTAWKTMFSSKSREDDPSRNSDKGCMMFAGSPERMRKRGRAVFTRQSAVFVERVLNNGRLIARP